MAEEKRRLENEGQDNDSGGSGIIERAFFARSDVLLTAGIVALLWGLLIPLPGVFLDILTGFIICLGAVVVFVSLFGKEAGELGGFVIPAAGGSVLRLGMIMAAARGIFQNAYAGVLIERAGEFLTVGSIAWSVGIFPILSGVMFFLIFRSSGKVCSKSLSFTRSMVPLKRFALRNRLGSGFISEEAAEEFEKKINEQGRFFLGIASASRLMRFEAILVIIVVVVMVFGGIAMGMMGRIVAGGSPERYVTLAVGAGIFAQVPALACSLGISFLVRKTLGSASQLDVSETVQPSAGKRPVDAYEAAQEEAEVLNPDFEQVRQSGLLPGDSTEPVDGEVVDVEFEEQTPAEEQNCYVWKNEDRGTIAAAVKNVDKKGCRVLLLCSAGVEDLPVTAAINVTLEFARSGRRCLIVDADPGRKAVCKVFDVDSEQASEKAVSSSVPTIDVFQVSERMLNSKDVEGLGKAIEGGGYGFAVVYSPNCEKGFLDAGLGMFADKAVFCGSAGGVQGREIMRRLGDKIITPGQE